MNRHVPDDALALRTSVLNEPYDELWEEQPGLVASLSTEEMPSP